MNWFRIKGKSLSLSCEKLCISKNQINPKQDKTNTLFCLRITSSYLQFLSDNSSIIEY